MTLTSQIDNCLKAMQAEIASARTELLEANVIDVAECDPSDKALYDRLFIDDKKVDGMIESLEKVVQKPSPVGQSLYTFTHEQGMQIENKTVPFGNILIVYESRPDVTVEATSIALKSGNHIILKGGKEARRSNLILANCWTKAIASAGLDKNLVTYLDKNRTEFQAYLEANTKNIDLIIPRGGQRLIDYVNSVATCPVLVSGRGNNFLYVSEYADLKMAKEIIIQSKIQKISACNALDKVLVNQSVDQSFYDLVKNELQSEGVEVLENVDASKWEEEFLDMKIVMHKVADHAEAVALINDYSGKHSATIVTDDDKEADQFLELVDCAAVYHNASTRFTDGFQFGLGAEMAISTEKLHHRGPLGIEHLVTNKWYIKGHGQTR